MGWGVAKGLRPKREPGPEAPDQGNARRAEEHRVIYENGWGVAKDYAEAQSLVQKAADQGNADAIAYLKELPRP